MALLHYVWTARHAAIVVKQDKRRVLLFEGGLVHQQLDNVPIIPTAL
jgi:hypothetical protein